MTRFGFFLFNFLLVISIYGIVFLNGAKPAAISYMLKNFSFPYIALLLVMSIISSIRWFMSHDPDIAKEIVGWINSLWFVPIITVAALYLIGGIEGNFVHGLHSLLTLR